MQRSDHTRKSSKRRNKVHVLAAILIGEGLLIAVLAVFFTMKGLSDKFESGNHKGSGDTAVSQEQTPQALATQAAQKKEEDEQAKRKEYLKKADLLAQGYDCDAAIASIKEYKNYSTYPEFVNAIADYEKQKSAYVNFGAYSSAAEVNHIFFHSLIADTSKAFDGDYDSNGYDYYMTTISEFKEMMRQMYENGYVLVSIHDVVRKVKGEDGTESYKDGEILLPPDKKPFVLSQDDVNYYDYMDGDGFASRMVVDQDGKPSTEMILEDGTTVTGAYDLVPVLEEFISEHPDFSYRGARGMICLTGYEGTLGYRTDPASKDSPTFEQDKETVKNVAKVMKEYGWEFACHSNGHRNMQECKQSFLEYDTNQWLENVGSLVGETDVYVYPYGIDVQPGVKTYSNERYLALKNSGFSIFCGVEAKPWMQIKKDYVRMQRRPLDGQAMLMYPERLADLFDLSTVIDPARPALK